MYIQGDIHDVLPSLASESVHLIYTDPPFGTTGKDWDRPLRWPDLWPHMWRVLRPGGTIVIYASMPFTYTFLATAPMPKYHYTWIKSKATNFLHCRYQPLRNTEEIFVFYRTPRNAITYNPQMEGTDVRRVTQAPIPAGSYYHTARNGRPRTTSHVGSYPTTARRWPTRLDGTGITRTDAQIDFFVKTYSNTGDFVLDMTCHNTTVGARCAALGREYLGVDLASINP